MPATTDPLLDLATLELMLRGDAAMAAAEALVAALRALHAGGEARRREREALWRADTQRPRRPKPTT